MSLQGGDKIITPAPTGTPSTPAPQQGGSK